MTNFIISYSNIKKETKVMLNIFYLIVKERQG